jgi:hypothetical protein
MNDFISDEYRDLLRAKHAEPGWGDEGSLWEKPVRRLAERLGAEHILDYGCGKGTLKPVLEKRGFIVTEYDPGVPGKDSLPRPADLVACTDVLEHIEFEALPAVLSHIYSLATRGAYFVIACRPALHKLPDGRNAHLIVESSGWWLATLALAGPWTLKSEIQKHGRVLIVEAVK